MNREFRNDAELDLYRCAVMLKSIAASLEELVKLEKAKRPTQSRSKKQQPPKKNGLKST